MCFQLLNCVFLESREASPGVHGINFSPGRSLKKTGMNMINATAMDREEIAVVKPKLLISAVPATKANDVPTILVPHINPFALACSLIGITSTAIPSVATSWKAPKKLMKKPAVISPKELFNGSGINPIHKKLIINPNWPKITHGRFLPIERMV